VPRVSVLLPARDAAATLRAAAVSILRQTERDLSLVCVDDGSRDGTAEVLSRLAARDRRVRVVAGAGEGIARALERGRAACDAEIVARMDADDVAHPRRLEVQRQALLADRSLAAVGGRVRLFPRRALRAGMIRYAAWLNGLTTPELVERDLLVEAPIVHPTAAIRSEALAAAGGWREGPFPEDYDLWLRLSLAGARLTNVPALVLDWRDGPARATRADPRYALERHVALKCAHLAQHVLGRGTEVVLWGAGATGKAFADALRAEGIGTHAFLEVDPAKIGRKTRGAPVLPYSEAARFRGLPILVAVGAPGARDLIRAELRAGRGPRLPLRGLRSAAGLSTEEADPGVDGGLRIGGVRDGHEAGGAMQRIPTLLRAVHVRIRPELGFGHGPRPEARQESHPRARDLLVAGDAPPAVRVDHVRALLPRAEGHRAVPGRVGDLDLVGHDQVVLVDRALLPDVADREAHVVEGLRAPPRLEEHLVQVGIQGEAIVVEAVLLEERQDVRLLRQGLREEQRQLAELRPDLRHVVRFVLRPAAPRDREERQQREQRAPRTCPA